MGRQRYKTTKFHRERDQREALVKGLAEALILNESIETTLPKAKAVVSYTEKLITKAKKSQNKLHLRRSVIGSLYTLEAAHKLVDGIAPKLSERSSGYFRIIKGSYRKGDNTQLAKISFVDDLSAKPAKKAEPRPETAKKLALAKPKSAVKKARSKK